MQNLKSLRKEKGVSQQKVADAIGTNQQSIHRYEHGSYEPDIRTMKLLADYFNTSIDYLVGNTQINHKIEPVEKYDLNQNEAALIDIIRDLTWEHRKNLVILLDVLIRAVKK